MVRRQTQHAQRQVRQNRRVQRGFGLRMQAPAATGLPGTVEMPHDATPGILIHRPSHYLADDDVLGQGRGVPHHLPLPGTIRTLAADEALASTAIDRADIGGLNWRARSGLGIRKRHHGCRFLLRGTSVAPRIH